MTDISWRSEIKTLKLFMNIIKNINSTFFIINIESVLYISNLSMLQ